MGRQKTNRVCDGDNQGGREVTTAIVKCCINGCGKILAWTEDLTDVFMEVDRRPQKFYCLDHVKEELGMRKENYNYQINSKLTDIEKEENKNDRI